MAKITDLIEGYAEMTAEEQKAAVEAFEVPETPDLSKFIPKDQFDKTASELAAAKKTIRDNMSAEEAAKAALAEEQAADKQQIKELTRKVSIAENEGRLLKQNYSPELATALAVAIADGDTQKQFEIMAKHDAEREQALRADILRDNPKPGGGTPPTEGDKAADYAKSYGEKVAGNRKSANDIIAKYTK